jgi:hypothetical protein
MQMIRTTISLPEDVHTNFRILALQQKKTFNDVILANLLIKKRTKKNKSIDDQIASDFALFDEIARSGIKIDAVKAVREERDRDNA